MYVTDSFLPERLSYSRRLITFKSVPLQSGQVLVSAIFSLALSVFTVPTRPQRTKPVRAERAEMFEILVLAVNAVDDVKSIRFLRRALAAPKQLVQLVTICHGFLL